MTIAQFIFYTVWAIGCMFASSVLQHMWMMYSMEHRRTQCERCSKKVRSTQIVYDPQLGMKICIDCANARQAEINSASVTSSIDELKTIASGSGNTANLASQFAKQLANDPEGIKAYRKIIGLQSEREKFEEETGHTEDDDLFTDGDPPHPVHF